MTHGDPIASDPLERLKDFTAAQATKGNVSPKADVAAAWSELVADALRATPNELEPVLGLRGLRSPVLGRGLALAWPQLSADARNGVSRYLKSLDSERALSTRFSLFVELFEQDLSSAVGQLAQIPQGKRDVQSRLARVVKQHRERLGAVATCGAASRDVATAFQHFMEASGDLPTGTLADLLRAVVTWLISVDWERDVLARRNAEALKTALARLDPAFLPEFRAKLAGSPNLLTFLLPGPRDVPGVIPPAPAASPRNKETSGVDLATDAPLPAATVSQDHTNRGRGASPDAAMLDDSIQTLRAQLQKLESVRAAFQDLQAKHQAGIETGATLKGQVSRLDQEVAQARADALRLETELAAEKDAHRRAETRLEDLTRGLEEATAAHDRERQELLNRLQAGIEGRLAAFKTSVADALSRVVQGLPPQGTTVSAELGAVLLTRLHEVLELLDRVGIRAGVNESR